MALDSEILKPLVASRAEHEALDDRVFALEHGVGEANAAIVNTDEDPGRIIYVGSVTPAAPIAGDVWISPVA